MIDLTDDRGVAVYYFAAVDRLDDRAGNIDHDVPLPERKLLVVEASRGQGQLAGAHRGRDIQFAQRRAGNDTGLGQPQSELEVFHRVGQSVIPSRAAGLVLGQFALGCEPSP